MTAYQLLMALGRFVKEDEERGELEIRIEINGTSERYSYFKLK